MVAMKKKKEKKKRINMALLSYIRQLIVCSGIHQNRIRQQLNYERFF